MTNIDNNSGYSKKDWQKHYDDNDLRWDIGQISPPFLHLWEKGILTKGSVLIPGCGVGHEVVFFAQNGFDVTGIDFADGAVDRLTSSLRNNQIEANILNIDFFSLSAEFDNCFDLMLEQTFFCAIHPERRSDYAEIARRVLKPEGQLVALFYETGEEGGPPFDTNLEDVRKTFSNYFKIKHLEKTPHSIERRKNKEWLGILVKK